MPVPTWVPGQVLAASDVNTWFVPLVGYKTSNQSVASSATLIADSQLLFPAAANAQYYWQTVVVFEAAAGGDFKYQFNGPSGCALNGTMNYRNMTPADVVHTPLQIGGSTSSPGSGAGTLLTFSAFGVFTTGSTAGNYQFYWAQNSPTATATIVHAGSIVIATRIG